MYLDRVRCGVRRALSPEVVDQPVDRDGLAEMQDEGGEERPRLRSAELEEAALVAYLERPEQTYVEWPRVGRVRDVPLLPGRHSLARGNRCG
jgi:hypothetical protein